MPRTKEQYEKIRTEKQRLIKDSALSLFASKGYEATSISEIAQNAGISKGLLYNYFTSKEELLQTIWDDLLEEFGRMADPNNDGDVSDEEAGNFIDELFEMLKHRRNEMKLYYQVAFQPKVIEFLTTEDRVSRVVERQNLIYGYFARKFPFPSDEFGIFSFLVFFKGLAMVATYSGSIFSDEFLDRYKVFLKGLVRLPVPGNAVGEIPEGRI